MLLNRQENSIMKKTLCIYDYTLSNDKRPLLYKRNNSTDNLSLAPSSWHCIAKICNQLFPWQISSQIQIHVPISKQMNYFSEFMIVIIWWQSFRFKSDLIYE